ncbi:hypothetical protein ABKN59_001002 [Abortiporus biennis]
MPSVQASFYDFSQSVAKILGALLNSLFAVFHAMLALGQQTVAGMFQLGHAIMRLATDLTQGVVGFVFANFFALLIIGGGYYWYTTRQNTGKGTRAVKSK